MNYKDFQKKKNKKFIFGIASVVVVLAIAFSVFFVSKAFGDNKGYRTISVVETGGTVTVVKDGMEYSAYPGMHLQEGHVLVTAGDSMARLVLDGDKYVKVESGSRVVFETLGFLGSGKTRINLERGAITGELVNPLQEDQEFVVNTPNAVLAVRGTFFRIDLEVHGKGELRSNVLTYGGQVATRRVFPSGEVEEEEVLVDAGYRTAIHMDEADTVYVVEEVSGAKDTTGDDRIDIEPIDKKDISDADMVDIYYSAKNGHALFLTSQEAKADIDDRNISLENTVPVYEKAAEIVSFSLNNADEGKDDEKSLLNTLPDDSKTLAMKEMNIAGQDESESTVSAQEVQNGLLTDGSGVDIVQEETVVEETIREESESTDQREEPEEVDSDEDTGSDEDTENENEVHVHTEVYAGSETIHSKCSTCGETLSTTHEYTEIVTQDATCTSEGKSSQQCDCGYSKDVAIPFAEHKYEKVTRIEPTCSVNGSITTSCAYCGAIGSKTEIPATGHTENYVGSADIHSECSTCGETVSTTHQYTGETTLEATCAAVGEMTYTCACGHSYVEEIPTVDHNYATTINAPTDTQDGSKYDTCGECGAVANEEIIWGINLTNFPDEAFRNFVEATYNTDGEVGLCEAESAAVTSMTITADVEAENLYGIELFASLETLVVQSGYVQEIDVTSNAELSTLTVSAATGLTTLNCSYTAVSLLNVDGLNNLTRLEAVNSGMTSLSAQNCTNLTYVDASGSSLAGAWLIGCTNLVTLNLSNNMVISQIHFQNCSSLSVVDVTNCGSAFGNCIIYGKDSSITSQDMITGFDVSMTYWTTQ